MTKLSERAMLTTLSVGSWSGMLLDRVVTDEVNESYKAEKDAGRYNKRLIAAKFLTGVNSKIGIARRTHKLLTLPWEDNGTRILSAMGYISYVDQMKQQKASIQDAAKEFSSHMAEYMLEAQQRLGNMFKAADYPDIATVQSKFYIDVEIKPVPEAQDFRAKVSDASMKAIVKDIERRSNERIENALKDVFQRVADVTGKMVERLRLFEEPTADGERAKGVFRDSIVYNVQELANLLPALNITGDERLEKLQKQLLEDLMEHSPEVLRADSKARKLTADKAERIFKKASSYF